MILKRTVQDLFPFEPNELFASSRQADQAKADLRSLPICSGAECVRALERCGMLRFEEGTGVIWMECGATFVAVPACDALPAETLSDILLKSGLSTRAFLGELRSTSAPPWASH
jgi:hypothetical protein